MALPLRFSCARSWSSRESVSSASAFALLGFSEDSSSSARESDGAGEVVLCFAGRREAAESRDGERRDADGVRLGCRRRCASSPLRSRLFLSGRPSSSSSLRSGERLRFRSRRCLLCSWSSSAPRRLECRCELRSCRDRWRPLLSRSSERECERGACRRSRFSDLRSRSSSRSSRSQLRSLSFRSLRRSRSQSSDLLDLPSPFLRLSRSASAASSARALRSRRSCSSLSSRTSWAASA